MFAFSRFSISLPANSITASASSHLKQLWCEHRLE